MATETIGKTGWLVERNKNGFSEWLALYQDEVIPIGFIWTIDSNAALKYADQNSAQLVMGFYVMHYAKFDDTKAYSVTEHMWLPA